LHRYHRKCTLAPPAPPAPPASPASPAPPHHSTYSAAPISQVATKIVEIRDGEFRTYLGDYHYYRDKIAEEKEQARLAAIAPIHHQPRTNDK